MRLKTAFGFGFTLSGKPLQWPAATTRKKVAPGSLWLLVDPLWKTTPTAHCDDSKKSSSRQPSALGQFSAKSLASVWKCTPKRRSGQTTSGCLSTLTARLPKRPNAITRKNIPARQLSTFGQFSAKSLASVRKCTPKRRSGQTTSGCLFPPIARLPKRPAAITRKSTAPDSLRLWVDTLRKATPAFGNVPRKNIPARQLSAFGQSFSKNLSSGPLR